MRKSNKILKNNKILLIVSLIFLNGCAFSSLKNTCIDTEDGVKCATIEENLIYMENKNKSKQLSYVDNGTDNFSLNNSSDKVFHDELVRLMTSQMIDKSSTVRPTKVIQGSYRLMILPYTDEDKFYSGRYIYISAGKSQWVLGDYVISKNDPIKISVPTAVKRPKKEIEFNNRLKLNDNSNQLTSEVSSLTGYSVSAFNGLNCRSLPNSVSEILATYEYGKELNVIDDSSRWFKVRMYGVTCYMDSAYLDNRYMK